MTKTPEAGIFRAVSGFISHHATCPMVWQFNHRMGEEWNDAEKLDPSNGALCVVALSDNTFDVAAQRAGCWPYEGIKVVKWCHFDQKWFCRLVRAELARHADRQILDRMRVWYGHHSKHLSRDDKAQAELESILGIEKPEEN